MSDLSHPAELFRRLCVIEADLAARQNAIERAAASWYRTKRDREHAFASAYMAAEGTVEQRKAQAAITTATLGVEVEAEYEALKAVLRVLETRASVLQTLTRSQSRLEPNVRIAA